MAKMINNCNGIYTLASCCAISMKIYEGINLMTKLVKKEKKARRYIRGGEVIKLACLAKWSFQYRDLEQKEISAGERNIPYPLPYPPTARRTLGMTTFHLNL